MRAFFDSVHSFLKPYYYHYSWFYGWCVGVMVVVVLIGMILYGWILAPQYERLASLESDFVDSLQSVQSLSHYYSQLHQSPISMMGFEDLSHYFMFHLDDFYADHDSLLNQYELRIYSLDFQLPEKLDNGFSKVRFHIQLAGGYSNIGEYLYSLSERGFLLDYRQLGMAYQVDLGQTVVSLDVDVFFYGNVIDPLVAQMEGGV